MSIEVALDYFMTAGFWTIMVGVLLVVLRNISRVKNYGRKDTGFIVPRSKDHEEEKL